MNIQLQEHSSHCLPFYKRPTKAGDCVSKIQSVLCKERNLCLKVFVTKICLLIVIVYVKVANREITNKAIVVVYIKLLTVPHRIVLITKK